MNPDIRKSLAVAAGLILLALGATLARHQGLIDGDGATRVIMAAIGLMVVWYGNRAPKAFTSSAHARRVARVSGWTSVLSGLVYVGVWAFAPTAVATVVGSAAIAAGLALTLGYCFWLRRRGDARA